MSTLFLQKERIQAYPERTAPGHIGLAKSALTRWSRLAKACFRCPELSDIYRICRYCHHIIRSMRFLEGSRSSNPK